MSVFEKDESITVQQKTPAADQPITGLLPANKAKNQIPVLDGLRAIACLAVITYHVNYLALFLNIWKPQPHTLDLIGALLYFGDSGVILFFLLSGFLLFLPFAKALLFGSTWPLTVRFYLRRIFRIIPAYYVALFLIILFFHPELLHRNQWHTIQTFLTFSMDTATSRLINGPFWTLATEFQFYLLLPLIAGVFRLLVCRGSVHARMLKLTCCLFALLAWGQLTRYWGLHLADTSALDFLIPHHISVRLKPYIYGDAGKYFEVFAVGMLICMLYVYTQNAATAPYWQAKLQRLSPLLFITGLVTLFILSLWHVYHLTVGYTQNNVYQIFTFLDPYRYQLMQPWDEWQAFGYSISYGLCLCALLYASTRFKAPFEWPLLRWIGFISFSLYMWHLPLIDLFITAIEPAIRSQGLSPIVGYIALYIWVIILVFPLSFASYRWIEQPGIRVGEFLIRSFVFRGENRSYFRRKNI
jgi:peptidoglycan/LPS O-acetylase OafA/YrhL